MSENAKYTLGEAATPDRCPQCWSKNRSQLGELCVSTIDDETETNITRTPHSWHSVAVPAEEATEWINEDELPEGYPYHAMFPRSKLGQDGLGGVRIFPQIVGEATEREESAEVLARQFHETYERLAPLFGYATRRESAKPWAEVPEVNRNLMIAVCREILMNAAIGQKAESASKEGKRE